MPAPTAALSTPGFDVTVSTLPPAAPDSATLAPANRSDTTGYTPKDSLSPDIRIICDGPVCAIRGHDLPGPKKMFLDIEIVVHELSEVSEPLQFVPHGVKEDQYFLVDNTDNMNRQQQGKQGQYWDDCGAWESNSRGQKTTFVCYPEKTLTKRTQVLPGVAKEQEKLYHPCRPTARARLAAHDSALLTQTLSLRHMRNASRGLATGMICHRLPVLNTLAFPRSSSPHADKDFNARLCLNSA